MWYPYPYDPKNPDIADEILKRPFSSCLKNDERTIDFIDLGRVLRKSREITVGATLDTAVEKNRTNFRLDIPFTRIPGERGPEYLSRIEIAVEDRMAYDRLRGIARTACLRKTGPLKIEKDGEKMAKDILTDHIFNVEMLFYYICSEKYSRG